MPRPVIPAVICFVALLVFTHGVKAAVPEDDGVMSNTKAPGAGAGAPLMFTGPKGQTCRTVKDERCCPKAFSTPFCCNPFDKSCTGIKSVDWSEKKCDEQRLQVLSCCATQGQWDAAYADYAAEAAGINPRGVPQQTAAGARPPAMVLPAPKAECAGLWQGYVLADGSRPSGAGAGAAADQGSQAGWPGAWAVTNPSEAVPAGTSPKPPQRAADSGATGERSAAAFALRAAAAAAVLILAAA